MPVVKIFLRFAVEWGEPGGCYGCPQRQVLLDVCPVNPSYFFAFTPMAKPFPTQKKTFWQRVLPFVCIGGLLSAGIPTLTQAQSNPGFTWRWDGNARDIKNLSYFLTNGTPGFMGDTYRLEFGVQNVAISELRISYPDYFDGSFDPKAIEVRVGGIKSNKFFNLRRDIGEPVALREVNLDADNYLIQIVPAEVIPAGQPVRVILSNVRNPPTGGMYNFKGWIMAPGDVPLSRGVGVWTISIFRG